MLYVNELNISIFLLQVQKKKFNLYFGINGLVETQISYSLKSLIQRAVGY